jgi:hypothetical protein
MLLCSPKPGMNGQEHFVFGNQHFSIVFQSTILSLATSILALCFNRPFRLRQPAFCFNPSLLPFYSSSEAKYILYSCPNIALIPKEKGFLYTPLVQVCSITNIACGNRPLCTSEKMRKRSLFNIQLPSVGISYPTML